MPIVNSHRKVKSDSSNEEALKQQLLEKIAANHRNCGSIAAAAEDNDANSIPSDDEDVTVATSDYEVMIEKSRDIPLQKIVYSLEGCDLFNELCLRIDVNQRYAEVLPQWTDVAHLLEVDTLRTKWVETCVRPREGLTRAMLEIYMNDGGTLGDVLGALLKLECFEILEMVRVKVDRYLELHSMGSAFDPKTMSKVNDKFFSVLKTLMAAMGSGDPCSELQKFKNGLLAHSNVALMQSNSSESEQQKHLEPGFCDGISKFKRELHLDQMQHEEKTVPKASSTNNGKPKCRILLLFSQDGVDAANQAVEMASNVQHKEVEADLFRLNEVSLWYEVLSNPEACCLKWSYEADYIMPVLTPKFLQEIHCSGHDSDDDEGLLPTSPMLNRYMYTLARTQYTQAGSKNLKVRPIIPMPVLRQVRVSNALKIDPLLNSSWVALNGERFPSRIQGMLCEFARRRSTTASNGN